MQDQPNSWGTPPGWVPPPGTPGAQQPGPIAPPPGPAVGPPPPAAFGQPAAFGPPNPYGQANPYAQANPYGQQQVAQYRRAQPSFVQANSTSLIALAVSAVYVVIAMSIGIVFFGIIPVSFGYQAMQRKEPLGVLALVVGIGVAAFGLFAIFGT